MSYIGQKPSGVTGTGKIVYDTSPTISGNFNLSTTTITSSATAENYATYIINMKGK